MMATRPEEADPVILVTGATGFIGEQLVRSLLAKGERIRLLVRSAEKAATLFGQPGQQWEIAQGDLADGASIVRAMAGVERVYHLASWISYQAPYSEVYAVNVEGTRRLMEASRRAGVKRLVHMSSVAAGGPAVRDSDGRLRPRTEEDPPAPLRDPYGLTKLEQERLVREYLHDGIEVVVVRPSAVFGPGDPAGINTIFQLIRNRRLPFYLGSAQAVVNLVYVGDVVRGTMAAMEKGRSGEIYNLVGANLTQEQVFGLLAHVSGGRAPVLPMPVPVLLGAAHLVTLAARLTGRRRTLVHPNDVRSWTAPWIISDARARQELDLAPTDLAAAMRETLVWLSEDRSAKPLAYVE